MNKNPMRDLPLTPHEQREMFDMVRQTNRLLVGEQAPNGQILQVGVIQRVHRLENWKDNWNLKMAYITGAAVTIWYGMGELVKYLHEKITK